MMETSAAKAPIPAAGAAGAAAVPDEPVITIISSDGETFSIRANTVAHSHLLDGAVRRWAEVYQAPLQAPSHSSSGAHHGHRSGSLPDDVTTTDATADDPEETPDERFIEGYYDETASDVTATSGMIEDTLNNLNGRMASGVDGDADRPHVMRMVSVPVNDEEDLAVVAGLPHGDHTPPYVSMPVEAGTGLTAIDAVAAGGGEAGEMDDKDSDRTASVLPSSHEGSLSSSTTPTKLSSNNGEAPSPGAAPRSISPFLQDMTALTKGTTTTNNNNSSSAGVASSAKGGSLSGRGGGAAAALCNGSSSLSDVSSSTTTTTTAAAAGSAAGSLSKNGLALRSPGNALTSPVSRGSHPSPSALLDADQSTPSVLSDEEQEEEMLMGRDGGDGPASTSPTAAKADPRNLGDEGLEEGDTEQQPQQQVPSSANDNIPSSSPSPSPEATAVETLSHGSSAGNTAPRHADPLNPSNVLGDISGSGSSTIAAEGSSSSGGGVDVSAKPPSPSSRGRLNERRHTTIVIQAGAAEDESDDVESANVSTGNPPDPLAPHDLAVAALLNSSNTPGSSRSGNGVSNGTSSASPAPDWRSPSSCHQRTPCIADEDDVGVMVGDDENNSSERERGRENEDSGSGSVAVRSADGVSSSSTNHNTLNNINSGSGAAGRPVEEESNAAAASSSATNTGAHPLASSVKSSSAHSATDPDSTVLYKDGIRITSSAIVVDLLSANSPLTSASTPMVSPQSLRENANSLEGTAAAADAQDLLSPSSAGGHTVAGRDDGSPDGHAASMNSTTSAEGAASFSAAAGAGAATPKVNIHSSTLMLCIKYMTHFAEAEAAAAAAAATKKGGHGHHHHRRGRHHRHRRGPHGQKHRGDADENSSDEDSDDDDAATPSTSASSSTASTTTSTTTDSSDSDNAKSSDDDSEAASSTGSATSINPPVIIGAPSITINDESSGVDAAAGAASGGAAGGVKPGGPAIIPMPLPGPLVARLSPWERTFLYVDVLGAPEAVLTAATAILDVCPDFDYSCPGPYLSKPRVKAALMTPPPPPEGVHALVEVMAAAKQLQIDPLHALCAGWLADFMIRVSYGATDNFEAAHLIRQCLRVPSDWSRRETDCLKLENEWPANEDAE